MIKVIRSSYDSAWIVHQGEGGLYACMLIDLTGFLQLKD